MMLLGAFLTVLTVILLLLLAFIIYTGCGYADYYSDEHCCDNEQCCDDEQCNDAHGGYEHADEHADVHADEHVYTREDTNEKPCYSKDMVNKAVQEVKNQIYSTKWFGPDRKEEIDCYAKIAARNDIKNTKTLSIIRRMEVGQLIKISGFTRQLPDMKSMWKKSKLSQGDTILSMSKKLFLPPLMIVQKLQNSGVHICQSALKIAAYADLGSKENNNKIQAEATKFEDKVEKKLKKLGLKFLTEKQQRARGANMTPDFLLTTPIYYNGRQINWIDAKNFLAWESKLVYNKLKKQSKKYNTAFGHGAFIFSEGYVCDFDMDAEIMCMHDTKNLYQR